MWTMQKTISRLNCLPMFEFERPATRDEIQEIESELDVILPNQYVALLQHYSYVGWFGAEILGLRPIDRMAGVPSTVVSDCVSRTKKARQSEKLLGISRLPGYVVVSTDGGGGNFVLFTVGDPLEGQVHWYNLEDQTEPIRIWETFQDFLEYLIENANDP